MVSPGKETINVQRHGRASWHSKSTDDVNGRVTDIFLDKRHASQSDDGERPHKVGRLSDLQQASVASLMEDLTPDIPPSKLYSLLPSPSATKTDDVSGCTERLYGNKDAVKAGQLHHKWSPANSPIPGRKTRSPDRHTERPFATRGRSPLKPLDSGAFVAKWLSSVLSSEEYDTQYDMSLPPSKRSRSSESLSRRLSHPYEGSESTVSADKIYSISQYVDYLVALETKGNFMRPSATRFVKEDHMLDEKLLYTRQPRPDHRLFDDRFDKFHSDSRPMGSSSLSRPASSPRPVG
ncbi:hypothetical protein PV08_11824 [Exophiala spinifera]|uniref:Uncharacterized protein n=1 Tax=Exophiala spinifera TaxID=91928 RepID=A0A0D2ATL2_9EURO|nr:uncharacterized protein PV08_11824 [Exophiala spinifera]KIW10048.1 hypothetical protein PV08_11824 [Exophiala spinifera]